MNTGKEEEELLGAQVLYREWGKYLASHQRYFAAVKYLQKSMEYQADNLIWTLTGLCEAEKNAGHFNSAAKAASEAIKVDPNHLIANYTRAEALFYIAEFGGSLVYAHRGMLRDSKKFKPLVWLNQEIVEDCLGTNVPPDMLSRLFPWIKDLMAHRAVLFEKLKDEPDEFAGIDDDSSKFEVNDPEARLARRHKLVDRWVAARGLGTQAPNKFFLQSMLTSPALRSANKAGSDELKSEVDTCLERLQRQQNVLWTRKPMYAIISKMEGLMTPGTRRAKEREFSIKQCIASKIAVYLLRKVHNARLNRDYTLFFKLVDHANEKIGSYSLKLVPEKQKYLDTLYLMVGRAYADPRNLLRFGCDEEMKNAYLQRSLGIKSNKLLRDSDVAWPRTLEIRKKFQKCREQLSLANQPLEILWLYHELCKLFIEINRSDLARFYSKKTRDLSEELGYEEWGMHANHILLRIELSQNNRNEAKESAGWCLANAKKLKIPFLIDFYEKAIAYIDGMDVKNVFEEDNVTKRVKLISSLMPPDLRPEMDLLLNSMDSVPAQRRLSVMPGCRPTENRGNRSTVLPRPPPNYKKEATKLLLKKYAPQKSVLGYIDFHKYNY